MIDIQYIRENPDLVAEKSSQKGYPVDVSALLRIDEERRAALAQVEALGAQRHQKTPKKNGGKPVPALIDAGNRIKL
jgi:seryl-tRNA synthetase